MNATIVTGADHVNSTISRFAHWIYFDGEAEKLFGNDLVSIVSGPDLTKEIQSVLIRDVSGKLLEGMCLTSTDEFGRIKGRVYLMNDSPKTFVEN